MKKEMVLRSVSVRSEKFEVSRPSLFAMVKSTVLGSASVVFLARFYSRLLELEITPLQAFHLTHAQLAFFLMVFPLDFCVAVRLLLVVWFAVTLMQCRRSGLG